ncbi:MULTISPECIES: recombinase family protein [unclassified Microbacterium]
MNLARLPRPARRRAIGAIRVSKERDGMISPENQRYAIEQFAEREGIDIVEWVEGIDESGSKKKSAWWTRLAYCCEQIEGHQADVLVLWRVDRAARSKLKWAITEDRIETAGGLILSATEPNDQTPAGGFGRGVLVAHAEFMARSIGATWKETLERRVRHGLTPNGQRHFGYVYSRETKTYSIDPREGEVLAAMYRAYIAGDSARDIAERYTNPDARPVNGAYPRYARWNTVSVLRVLDSGFGAGLILFREQLAPGTHPPVISDDEWARYVHARDARRRRPRAERSPYTYSGLLYCHCGSKMGGRTDHGRPRYACVESSQYTRHADASLAAHVIDAEVVKWLQQFREELNAVPPVRRAPATTDPRAEITRKLAGLAERLDNATEKYLDGDIPKDAYERRRDRLEAERLALESELGRLNAQSTVQPVAFVGDLVSAWDDLPVERRREAIRVLVDRIEILPPGSPRRVVVHSIITRS